MAEKRINELVKKYESDIIMLDGLLQWALNPTSMSAVYGIEENYPYIEQNLKTTYKLTSDNASKIIETLKNDCGEIIRLKMDKHDIYDYQKTILKELAKPQYIKLFRNSIQNGVKESNQNIINFLNLYKNSPIKNFPGLNVQYNAIYGETINNEELIELGILKPLLWISSGKSRTEEVIPKFIPSLNSIINTLKLKKWKVKKPNPSNFMTELNTKQDIITLNFLEELYKKNIIYDIKINTNIKPEKGFIGIYQHPDPKIKYIGISFLIKNQLFELIKNYINEKLKEKTLIVKQILEYEINQGVQLSKKEIVRNLGIRIDEAEEYEKLINEFPSESFINDQNIIIKASEAIKQYSEPSLYDLLTALNYDIETARKVGKYLIDSKMIKEFPRNSKEGMELKLLKSSSEKVKKAIKHCRTCDTPLTDEENEEFCPFCGSRI